MRSLIGIVKEKYRLKYDLKKEQLDIISSIVSGRSCFGILPTGFGKSLTFYLPPLIFDEVIYGVV